MLLPPEWGTSWELGQRLPHQTGARAVFFRHTWGSLKEALFAQSEGTLRERSQREVAKWGPSHRGMDRK